MKPYTRIDIFANVDEVLKFYKWAEQFKPQSQEDLERLLADYKKPDLVVEGFKEHIEHKITEGLKEKENGR